MTNNQASETPQPQPQHKKLGQIRERLDALSKRGEQPVSGLDEVMSGLDTMLGDLEERAEETVDATLLEVLARGLNAVIDLFEEASSTVEEIPVEEEPEKVEEKPKVTGLQQFIEAFRKEAQKRLTGLSISMMGLFSASASEEALNSSAQHLHAIRGGAAMLTLKEVAELSGLMEQVIITMRKIQPKERTWPTKALMRGYQLLERALEDQQVFINPEDSESIVLELRNCIDSLSTKIQEDAKKIPQARIVKPAPKLAPPPKPEPTPDADGLMRVTEVSEVLLEPMEKRILIVDDVETIAASVGFVLSDLEVPLDIATDGGMALDMLRERPYSLVISDVAMPRLDGIALTNIIRNDETFKEIPVILLTSLDHPKERDAGIEAGANDYIIKGSIGGGELVTRVQALLEIAPMVPSDSQLTNGRKRILVAEDTETVAASIAFVLSEGDFDIVLTSDGKQALSRLQNEDFDLLISDWQMPTMSGFELIQAVRDSERVKQLPIVLLTSNDSDDVRNEAYSAGADRFLVKGQVGGGILLDLVEDLTAAPYSYTPRT